MRQSVQALLGGLIDYAGIFPPANLGLSEALSCYARYRLQPDCWMLNRFIVPAGWLVELGSVGAPLFGENPPFVFSVLGRGGSEVSAFEQVLREDLAAVAAFRQQSGALVVADTFEVRLPVGLAERELGGLLVRWLELFGEATLFPFFEIALDDNCSAAVMSIRSSVEDTGVHAGFKLRCGGATADAFPTPTQVARALVACRDAGVPMKATAGLHHPLRHFNAEVQAPMHGFLNLFGAGILAHVYDLPPEQVAWILADEDPTHFIFTNDTFAWQHLAATPDEVRDLRQRALLSYGSCSFDEPRADLRALGVLP